MTTCLSNYRPLSLQAPKSLCSVTETFFPSFNDLELVPYCLVTCSSLLLLSTCPLEMTLPQWSPVWILGSLSPVWLEALSVGLYALTLTSALCMWQWALPTACTLMEFKNWIDETCNEGFTFCQRKKYLLMTCSELTHFPGPIITSNFVPDFHSGASSLVVRGDKHPNN